MLNAMANEMLIFRRRIANWVRACAAWLSGGRLTVLTITYLLAICGVFAMVLLSEYEDAWSQATRETRNLGNMLSQDIARNIELYDLSLQGAVEGWENPEVRRQDIDLRRMTLFDRSATAAGLGAIMIIDARGDVVDNSGNTVPLQANFADHDYFKVQREHPDLGLFISHPFQTRMSREWSIALSRRLSRPDGSFEGVVVGTIRLSYLQKLFDKLVLGPKDSITLLHADGTVMMRRPYDTALLGRPVLPGAEVFAHIKLSQSGYFTHSSPIDVVERLYAYDQVGTLPLVQIIGFAADSIVTPWRRKALITAAAVLILCAAIAALTLLLWVQLRARSAAEMRLRWLAERDPLTGVYNRRRFAELMAAEWRRSSRSREGLSLLMLDVDCFKPYNDRYGHPAGDQTLQAVTACIEANTRIADVVGRYGGEEFAILLPGIQATDAAAVAERICAAIASLSIPHADSVSGVVTASIGVASAWPGSQDLASFLLQEADVALYAAKRDGRNRIACHPEGVPIRAAA